jgi:cell division protein ZapA
MDRTASRVIPVEIAGQRYPIRSHLDPDYISRLAAFVDERIRAAAGETASADPVKVVVLAALNIADELFRCRDSGSSDADVLRSRTEALERIVDIALADAGLGPPTVR